MIVFGVLQFGDADGEGVSLCRSLKVLRRLCLKTHTDQQTRSSFLQLHYLQTQQSDGFHTSGNEVNMMVAVSV